MNDETELINLEQKIKQAENDGKSIKEYVMREIDILQSSLDAFIQEMKNENRLHDISVAQIEIRQYATMKTLAQKINLPTEKYDQMIKDVRIRIFGEENYENFFGNDN